MKSGATKLSDAELKNALPDKLSDLVKLAVKDLVAVERSKRYAVDMSLWHSADKQESGEVCFVCFAGCVMAKTLKAYRLADLQPYDYRYISKSTQMKLLALDSFRLGCVEEAQERVSVPLTEEGEIKLAIAGKIEAMLESSYVAYHNDPAAFKSWARRVAEKLAKYGL